MSRVEILNTEFPGQTAWKRFSDCYADVEISERDAVIVDADIAQVLLAKLGTAAQVNKWLQKPLPALEGASVTQILERPDGARIVRSLVMRMP